MENKKNFPKQEVKSDLKLNLMSFVLMLFGSFLFLVAIKSSIKIGPKADTYILAGEFILLLGFVSAIIAKKRNEPRHVLTIIMLIVYGLAICVPILGLFFSWIP